MKAIKWSLFAAAIAGGDIQIAMGSQQSEAKGFLEDGQIKLTNRNYFFNHDKKEGRQDASDWAHALMLNYQSGYTRGLVGFGVDAFAYGVLKLHEYGRGGGNVMIDNKGDSHSFSHVGGAAKVRLSNTVLKYGIMQPITPVFAAGGLRILPETAQGFLLQSSELSALSFQAGHFTAATGWQDNGNHDPIKTAYGVTEVDSVSFVGGDYTVTKNLSVSLYASRFEDVWRQYYGSASYMLPISGNQALKFGFNLYRTLDEGRAKAGQIDTTAWSLAGAYTLGAHTFKLAYQKVHGDEPFDYAGFGDHANYGDSIYLSNSVQYSDFNGPGERSLQARYDLDMGTFGFPGLSFMARYLHGTGIDGTHADPHGAYAGAYGKGDRERETDVEMKYVVQSGPAKDLAFRVRQAWHRGDRSTGGTVNQFRLMVEYPFDPYAAMARH